MWFPTFGEDTPRDDLNHSARSSARLGSALSVAVALAKNLSSLVDEEGSLPAGIDETTSLCAGALRSNRALDLLGILDRKDHLLRKLCEGIVASFGFGGSGSCVAVVARDRFAVFTVLLLGSSFLIVVLHKRK